MLEVCIDSVESALAARDGGADRLELCSALIIGGLSPSPALWAAIRRRGVAIPARAMVRPRFGDFLYTDAEKEQMLEEARGWRDSGVEGVVTGALTSDGTLDEPFLRDFIAASPRLRHTLHRAFDLTADPFAALETAIRLGFDTILTSGQQSAAPLGAELLKELHDRAAGRIEILVGAGVSAESIPELRRRTGCTSFHLSGKTVIPSGMKFRREGVPMGLPGLDEFSIWRTDAGRVHAAAAALGTGLTPADQAPAS